MPTIINPYKSGGSMGEDLFGLGGLADAFFGPKASQSAYTREKFREAQRQNEFLPQYASAMAAGGDPGNIAKLAILAGQTGADVGNYGRYVTVNRNANDLTGNPTTAAIVAAGGAAGSTPSGFAQELANKQATEYGRTDRLVEADRLKNERELLTVFDPTNPTGTKTVTRAQFIANPGAYNIVPSQDVLKAAAASRYLLPGAAGGATATPSIATTPIMSPDDAMIAAPAAALSAPPTPAMSKPLSAWLGAEEKTDKGQNFYVTDAAGNVTDQGVSEDNGRTRVGGAPITLKPGERINIASPLNPTAISTLGTAPGKAEQKDFRTAVSHADSTLKLGSQILDIVNKNPTAVGAVGNLRRMGQEGVDLLNSLNTQFGSGKPGGYEQAVAETRNEMRRKFGAGAVAMIPELFDDDLNSITTMNGMLLYKAAAAMGQSGRDASDKDIANVRNYVGSPDSWFQGPGTYRSKVGSLMRIVKQQRDDDFSMLQPGARVGPSTAVVPAANTAPAAASPVIDDLLKKYGAGP